MRIHLFVSLFLLLAAAPLLQAGNWKVIPSPNANQQPNELHGVSALAEDDVWAVGVAYLDKNYFASQTLIEHWNGSTWTVVPSPNSSTTQNILNAVAAVSANDVWAVGFAANGTSNNTVIQHWNGSIWSIVPGPATSMTINNLAALAVVSANDIWAVGTGRVLDEDGTVTIHWDGASWSLVPSPNVTPEVDNTLAGVTAVASNDVWAVGTQQPTSLTDPHTLILHWNGSAWSIVPSPNDGGSTVDNHLLAATSNAANDVWAVGFSGFGALSEHWNGVAWSVVHTPDIAGSEFTDFASAVALGNSAVWAVGDFFETQFSRSRTLTEFWNGSSWGVVRSANRGSSHNSLFGVSATPGGTLWAVGTIFSFPNERTLILRKSP